MQPFFLFVTFLCAGVCVLGALFLPNHLPSKDDHGQERRLTFLYVLGIATIVAVVTFSFLEEFTGTSKLTLGIILVGVLSLYPFALFGAPVIKTVDDTAIAKKSQEVVESQAWRMLSSGTFVLLFGIFTLLIGPGISLLNNLSPLVISRDDLDSG